MMTMMKSLQPLELRKMAVGSLLCRQALLARRCGSSYDYNYISVFIFFRRTAISFSFILYLLSFTQAVESSGPLGKGQKRKAGQMNKTITIGSSPILYTQPAASAGKKKKKFHYTSIIMKTKGKATLNKRQYMYTIG